MPLFRKSLANAAAVSKGEAEKPIIPSIATWFYRRTARVLPMLAVALVIFCVVLFRGGAMPLSAIKEEGVIKMMQNYFPTQEQLRCKHTTCCSVGNPLTRTSTGCFAPTHVYVVAACRMAARMLQLRSHS